MRASLFQVVMGVLLIASPLVADEQLPWEQSSQTSHTRSTTPPVPAVWGRSPFAQEAIYQRAAMRAAQRHERMAIQQALGYSPLRPPASTVPFMGSPIIPVGIGVRTHFPGMMFRHTGSF